MGITEPGTLHGRSVKHRYIIPPSGCGTVTCSKVAAGTIVAVTILLGSSAAGYGSCSVNRYSSEIRSVATPSRYARLRRFARIGRGDESGSALPLQERALAIIENAYGPDHPSICLRLGNVAATLSDLGRHTDALPLKQRALTITENAYGPDHPDVGLRLNNLAATLSDLGRHTDALPLQERALTITEARG